MNRRSFFTALAAAFGARKAASAAPQITAHTAHRNWVRSFTGLEIASINQRDFRIPIYFKKSRGLTGADNDRP